MEVASPTGSEPGSPSSKGPTALVSPPCMRRVLAGEAPPAADGKPQKSLIGPSNGLIRLLTGGHEGGKGGGDGPLPSPEPPLERRREAEIKPLSQESVDVEPQARMRPLLWWRR